MIVGFITDSAANHKHTQAAIDKASGSYGELMISWDDSKKDQAHHFRKVYS
jgi:hypothetical protein